LCDNRSVRRGSKFFVSLVSIVVNFTGFS